MSLSATLSNALTGLNVAQHGLSLTAHNVVNANTEGFARKTVNPETQVVANRGAGVRSGDVERVVDRFLTQEIRRQATTAGETEVIDRFHGRLQDFLGRPGENTDLALRIAALEDAFEALAATPETGALRTEILGAAEDLTAQIGDLAGEIQRLRADADQEIGIAVRALNDEAEQIADLNAEIVRLQHVDQSNPELLDRRDALVRSIAEKLDVSTFIRDDGALVVQTGAGIPLVDETAMVMVYEPAQQVDATTTFGAIRVYHPSHIDPATGQPDPTVQGTLLVSSGVRAELNAELQNDATPDADQVVTSRLRGGEITGLLEVRDGVLPDLDDQIQELADGLRFAVNAAHNGTVAVPPPTTLAGTRTDLSDFASATRSGTATVAVVDRTDGSTVTAIAIDLGAAADETDVVAQINTGLGALGTATIGADGALQITLADASQGLAVAEGDGAVTIQDAAGRDRTFGFSHYFGLNDVMVQKRSRPSSIAVRPELLQDPARIGTAMLDVTGPPLAATLGGSGDNRGALAVAAALRAGHDVIARGALAAGTVRLEDYAASIIATTSAAANQASDKAASESSLAEALDFRAAAISGVNVDEEMSRLVQLQKSYTVAARLISVTDEMFDELFRAAQ